MRALDLVSKIEDEPFADGDEVRVDVGAGQLEPIAAVKYDDQHECFVITVEL